MAITIFSNKSLLDWTPSGRHVIVDGVTVTATNITRSGDTVTISGLRITGNARDTSATLTSVVGLYFGIPTGNTGAPANQLSPWVAFTSNLQLTRTNSNVNFDYTAASDLVFNVDRYATTANVGVLAGGLSPSQAFPPATTATVTFPRDHPFYGSVNGKSKLVQKLYYPVNGKSKEIKKLYGSVNGKSKLIYQAADYGRVYYEVGTSGEIRSVELKNLAEFNSLAGTAASMSIGGGTVTVTRARGTGNNSIVGLDIGSRIDTTPLNFLRGCTNFTRALTIPANVTTIGNGFMFGCTAFNSPLALPDTITTIGTYFMCECTAFNQILSVGTPTSSAITGVGAWFMYNCKAMTNQVQLYFTPGYMDQGDLSFATDDSSAACYTTGIQIVAKTAADKNTFLSRFPNSTSQPYRKLR